VDGPGDSSESYRHGYRIARAAFQIEALESELESIRERLLELQPQSR